MARYVVIEFDRNDDAEVFLEGLKLGHIDGHRLKRLQAAVRVVGVFVKPGKRCECWDRDTVNYRDPTKEKNAAGVARGGKFGWWVCSRCKKPRLAGHQLLNQLDLSETFEAPLVNDEWETQVDELSITSIHRKHVKRKKKLRMKREK